MRKKTIVAAWLVSAVLSTAFAASFGGKNTDHLLAAIFSIACAIAVWRSDFYS